MIKPGSPRPESISPVLEVAPSRKIELIEQAIKQAYDSDEFMKYHDVIHRFGEKIQEKYGKNSLGHNAIFHKMIGSSPDDSKELQYVDFSGDYSILGFIKKINEEDIESIEKFVSELGQNNNKEKIND